MRLELGTRVRCTDGVFGELADLVVEPEAKRVTHLVVQPQARPGKARLVPIELATEAPSGPEIRLRCAGRDVRRLEQVREVAYGELPGGDADWDVGVRHADAAATGLAVVYDRIPKGTSEVRRSSAVTSVDGERLGEVEGLIVDGAERITHVVLEHGSPLARREAEIPVDAVASVETDAVVVDLSPADVLELDPERRAS